MFLKTHSVVCVACVCVLKHTHATHIHTQTHIGNQERRGKNELESSVAGHQSLTRGPVISAVTVSFPSETRYREHAN